MDDDFQTPPVEIPKLLGKLDEGFDLVYGARGREQHGLVKKPGILRDKVACSTRHERPTRAFDNFVSSFPQGLDA